MNDLDERLRKAFAARAATTLVNHRHDVGSEFVPRATGPSRSWTPILGIAAVTVAVIVVGLALISRSPIADEVPTTVPPARRCEAITQSTLEEAGDWSLIRVDDLSDVDTCVYVLDTGRLQVRFRTGDTATDTSTGWIGLSDLVESSLAEGSQVVELGIGDESYLIDDTSAGARTDRGAVVISVQNGLLRIDRQAAAALLAAGIEALG